MRRGRLEREMADEMAFHVAARAEELTRRGLSGADALRQARVEFGGMERYKEECRESVGLRLVDELRADLCFAWRQLRRAPVFSFSAVSILAIGIGASAAVFSTADAALLRLLPVAEPQQLRRLAWLHGPRTGFLRSYNGDMHAGPGDTRIATSFSYPVYEHLRSRLTSFTGLVAFGGFARLNLTIQSQAHLASGQIVTGNYFAVLGTRPLLGRVLAPEDDHPGALAFAAVLSHRFWRQSFGGDRGILGKAVQVNGTPVVIVGVLPRGSCGIDPSWCPDLVLPLAMQPIVDAGPDVLRRPDYWYFEVMGRLKPEVGDETARAETERLVADAILASAPPEAYDPPRVLLLPGAQGLQDLRSDLSPPLLVLAGAVSAVVLIACANIAGLLLARSSARRREMATRLALGAGRGRLIRQLLTESLLLSTLGGVAGILSAHIVGDGLARLFLASDRPLGVEIALSGRVLLFSIALLVVVGLAFGLAPALRSSRTDPTPALRASYVGAAARSRPLAGKAVIVVQVAVSLVLTAGAALFVRTLVNLRSEPLGFRPENVLVFQLNPTLNGYREARLLDFHEQVTRRLETLPGVRSASMSRWGLLAGSRTSDGLSLPGGQSVNADVHYVAPRFFETMGVPLLLGRDLAWTDRESAPRVVVVNRALARRLFPDDQVLGRRVHMSDIPVEIVGIAGDTKFDSLRQEVRPTAYVPFRQNPQYSMTYALRSEVSPGALTSAVRRAVADVDPNVPLYEVRTQTERIGEAMRHERLFALLLSGFALLALLLASVGIYGTLAYQVGRRTPEIGLRLALGAGGSDIVRLILGEVLAPVVLGIGLGVATALAGGRVVEAMLFGVTPRDPQAFLTAAAVLVASAALAAWWPARRASRIAPMEALRNE